MRRLTILLLFLLPVGLAPLRADDGTGGSSIEESDPGKAPPEEGKDPGKVNAPESAKKPSESGDDADAPVVGGNLQARINKAIELGVKWLKSAQGKDGSWGPCKANRIYGSTETGDFTRDPTGPTSFSVFTLSKCGVPSSDPVVRKGFTWVKEQTRLAWDQSGNEAHAKTSTYESASILMMLEAMYDRSAKLTGKHTKRLLTDNPRSPPDRSRIPKDDWKWMHERVIWLTTGIRAGGNKGRTIKGCQNPNGGWRYGQGNGDQDLSATQFVILGLRAASQAGYPFDESGNPDWRNATVWDQALNYVKSMQNGDGSFSYQAGQQFSAGMSAAGLACLIICKEQLELIARPIPSWVDGAIEKGFKFLDSVFEVGVNQGLHEGVPYIYYYLYGIERLGDLTGRKEFNSKDWYVRGAEYLLAQQEADGKWTDQTCMIPRDVLGTCFALLFLKRATPPTVTITTD